MFNDGLNKSSVTLKTALTNPVHHSGKFLYVRFDAYKERTHVIQARGVKYGDNHNTTTHPVCRPL